MSIQRFKDVNFFTKLYVSNTEFSDSVKASWKFISIGIALMVESNDPSDVVQYSFDGINVHGDMTPTFPSEAIIFDNRFHSAVWFKRESSGAPVAVRIEAWRHMA